MSQHDTLTSTVDAIMEQAQVFASAWSLVGGMFDKGGMLEEANDAKAELREIVSAALSATQPAQAAQSEPVRHVGDSKFESWYQAHPKANGGDKQLASDAYAAGMSDPVAQGAGEVVYQIKGDVFQCPHAWRDTDEETFHMVTAKDRRIVYTTPSQPAPVVPDGWKLVPIKCTEAMKDVGGQFEFATIADGRLLAQSMWNELLLATPTPPEQAAQQGEKA